MPDYHLYLCIISKLKNILDWALHDWPIKLTLIFCVHGACAELIYLSTQACDTSTARERRLCTCCFDHNEQSVPSITLKMIYSHQPVFTIMITFKKWVVRVDGDLPLLAF